MIEQDEQFKQDKVDLLFRCSLGESQTSLLADYQKAKQECSERIADNKIPRFRGVKLTGLDVYGKQLHYSLTHGHDSTIEFSDIWELSMNTPDEDLCKMLNSEGKRISDTEYAVNLKAYKEHFKKQKKEKRAEETRGQTMVGSLTLTEYEEQTGHTLPQAKLSWWKCLFMGSR